MDFQKLTLKSQEAVAAAQELARRAGQPGAHARPPHGRRSSTRSFRARSSIVPGTAPETCAPRPRRACASFRR